MQSLKVELYQPSTTAIILSHNSYIKKNVGSAHMF